MHMGGESGPLEDERNSQPESLPEDDGGQGRGLRCSNPPTRALGSQRWSKVEHLQISLPRMQGGEQENLRSCYAGPPHSVFMGDILSVPEAFRHIQEQGSPLDGGPIYWTQLQRREPLSLHPRPQSFH
jgi:hypothetical protein